MTSSEAIVVKNAGSHFLLSQLPKWELFPAVLRGRVRLAQSVSTNPVAVGDRVRFSYEQTPSETCPATITEVLPRANYLIRRSTNLSRQAHIIAANLDCVIACASLYFPEIKLPFLDRVLVSCGVYGINTCIVLNKVDMYRDLASEQIDAFLDIYTNAGYKVIICSARTGEGIDDIRDFCKGKLSLICGESGVGKSSIIKAIDPGLNPKTGDISEVHLQGKHTTSLYEMYPLSSGGYLIDAPGLRGFGLVDLEKEEISKYFPEMLRYMDQCRFAPCTHTHEPDCAVKAALDAGEISPERYNSYLGMLEQDQKFR